MAIDKILRCVFCLLLFMAVLTFDGFSAQEQFNRSDWQYWRSVEVNLAKKNLLHGFPLDFDMIQHGGIGLKNFRLVDVKKNLIPYAITQAKDQSKSQKRVNLKIVDYVVKDGIQEVILSSPLVSSNRPASVSKTQPILINKIEIKTSGKNFHRRASVQGSFDQKNWETLIERTNVFDLSSQIDFRKNTIEFKASQFKFYKLLFTSTDEGKLSSLEDLDKSLIIDYGDLHIRHDKGDGSSLAFKGFIGHAPKKKKASKKNEIILQKFQEKYIASKKTTRIVIPDVNIPLNSIEIRTPNKNFLRSVRVYAHQNINPQLNGPKRMIGQGELFDFIMDGFYESNFTIPISVNKRVPAHLNAISIEIENQDSSPLTVSSIKLEWSEHRMLFYPSPTVKNKVYHVYYGSDKLRPLEYADIQKLASYSRNEEFVLARVGRENRNTTYKQPASTFFQKNPMIMNAIVLVLALGLFIWLWTLIRKSSPPNKEK